MENSVYRDPKRIGITSQKYNTSMASALFTANIGSMSTTMYDSLCTLSRDPWARNEP